MSPIAGISYLDRALLQDIHTRPGARAANDRASFIGHFIDQYSASGTDAWPAKSAEWFIVDMLTKLLETPRSLGTGRTIPGIQNAYLPLVRDLVRLPCRM